MQYATRFPGLAGLVALLVGLMMPSLNAQPAKPQIPNTKPNLALSIVRKTGNCPNQVSLWTSFRYYEGGGEHTVIADTAPISKAPAVLVEKGPRFVQYEVPLKPDYATCSARAIAPYNSQYSVRFNHGIAYFEVDLTLLDKPPSTPAVVTYRAVLTGRPYVRWAIAD